MGNLNFGLSSYGDAVRLFNDEEILQDEVVFDVKDPWPECASGTGHTFELAGTNLDNSDAENWLCINNHGSPGSANDLGYSVEEINRNSFKCYPNPTNQLLYVTGINDMAEYRIMSSVGQEIISGTTKAKIDVSQLTFGVYFIELTDRNSISILKFMKR